MEQARNPGLEAQLAAALDWWRDAGVDAVFSDDPVNWLAPAGAPKDELGNPSEPDRAARRSADSRGAAAPAEVKSFTELPESLDNFTAWWLSEPTLDGGRTAGRVPPRGEAGAKLMILVPEPEREDGEILLSGPQGKLLEAMLQAMGIAPAETYVASVLPRHTPHPDWDSLAAQGIGRVAAHHVALVRPAALIAFGQNIPSLLNNDLPNSPAHLLTFNHDGATVPWFSDRSLGAMLERPRWKAGFWQRWLTFGRG